MTRYRTASPFAVIPPARERVITYFTNKYGDQCALVGEAGAVQSLCELLEVAGIRWQGDLGTFDEGFYLSDVAPSDDAS